VERTHSPAREHLKEIGWACFLFTLIFGLVGVLMAKFLGAKAALWLFLIPGVAISALIGGLAVLNVLFAWVYERWEARRRGPGS
jgi:Mn2+/Fe2+ NRAMP family transporter